MRIKQRPRDFRVAEEVKIPLDPGGEHYVYRIAKRKITTFDAVRRLAKAAGVPLGSVSYCGLKDKQSHSLQHVSIKGRRLEARVEGLRVELVGRSQEAISSGNLVRNRFAIVIRDLDSDQVTHARRRLSMVRREGVVRYFDDQRFGAIRYGQGFLARDLISGNHEQALRRLVATPSPLDRSEDHAVKVLFRDYWGQWDRVCQRLGARRFARIAQYLRKHPQDFAGAFVRMEAKERALHLFSYQSYIWNESAAGLVRRLMKGKGGVQEAPYLCGSLVFPADVADAMLLERLARLDVPLVDHELEIDDPDVRTSVLEVLQREGLTMEGFRVRDVPGAFFRAEPRALMVRPRQLRLGRPEPDEENPGRTRATLRFTLPPGCYATVVLKRLFPEFAEEQQAWAQGRARQAQGGGGGRKPQGEGGGRKSQGGGRGRKAQGGRGQPQRRSGKAGGRGGKQRRGRPGGKGSRGGPAKS